MSLSGILYLIDCGYLEKFLFLLFFEVRVIFKMDQIKDGWFSESTVLWPGQSFRLKVKEILFNEKSDYQDVLLFES